MRKFLLILLILTAVFSLSFKVIAQDPYSATYQAVTISITGEQQTEVIDKSHYKYMSIIMPSAWTAADITFLGSLTSGGTFNKIVQGSDEGELTIKASASEVIGLDSAALQNTLMAVPFIKLRSGTSGSLEVEDCEDTWDELQDGDVTHSVDATDYKVGAKSVKWVCADALAAGDIIATETIALDLATASYEGIRMWIKSSVDTVAGNLKLLLDEDANCASPSETLSIPALEADEWIQVNMNFASVGDADLDTLISVGVEFDADLGECTIHIDDLNAVLEVAQAAERDITVVLYR